MNKPNKAGSKREKPATSVRAWQRMLSGRRLDLIDPSPLDIEIEDIAHGLARVARWNGQTLGDHSFSVAQHCLLVEELFVEIRPKASVEERLAVLLHDASEYVIGDMISPFKRALGVDYRTFEDRLEHVVHIRFSLPPKMAAPLKKIVKKADLMSAWLEAVQLAGFNEAEADQFFIRPPENVIKPILVLPTKQAQSAYLQRFAELQEMRDPIKG